MYGSQIVKSLFLVLAALILLEKPNDCLAQSGKTNNLPRVAALFLGTWTGKGATPEGEEYISELTFKWTLNRNFLEVQNMIETNGKRQQYAQTLYGWHPVLQQIVFWSFDKNGAINEGVAELEGDNLKHEWRSFSKGGEIRDWRSILILHDKYNLTFSLMDGKNEVMISIKYNRSKD